MPDFRFFIYFVLILFCILCCFAVDCFAVDLYYGAEVSDQVTVENNYINNASVYKFNKDETNNFLIFSPFINWAYDENFSGYFMSDIYSFYVFDDNSNETDVELENAFISYKHEKLWSSIGLQPFSFGRGFILDSNEPGLLFEYGLKKNSHIKLQAAQIFDKSSMLSVELGIEPGLFEKVELFAVFFRENDDRIAGSLNEFLRTSIDSGTGSLNEFLSTSIDSSNGNIYWYGCGADLFILDFFFTGTAIIQNGDVDLGNTGRGFELSSALLDIEATYNITDRISASAFFLYVKGGLKITDNEMDIFIAPLSSNKRTSIFYNEEYDESICIMPAGLVSPGLKFDFYPDDIFSANAIMSLLFPEDSVYNNRSFYGWEVDFELTYMVNKNQALFFETDFFYRGDYYKDLQGEMASLASRYMIGYSINF